MSTPRISKRLQACLNSGGIFGLFSLLSEWTLGEIADLLRDIEKYGGQAQKEIDAKWKDIAFSPSVFLSRTFSERVDNARRKAEMELFSVLAEISSVAHFYLNGDTLPRRARKERRA